MTTPYASDAYLHQLLGKALSAQASDVHLKVGQPPGGRVNGELVYFRAKKIVPEDTEAVARLLLGGKERLEGLLDRVLTYEAAGVGRFRVTIFRQRGSLALVLRHLPAKIPTLEELGLPPTVAALIEQGKGLVVVAGGAGHGKSTTLAAMVGHLNASFPRHVITIEDPIEILHEDHRSSVSQREIGLDAPDITAALHAARRQDADAIMAATLDGAAALDAALSLVEAGRLVLTALSVPDASRAVTALVHMGRGSAIDRARILDALAGVIGQRLAPKREGAGLALEAEILVMTEATRKELV